MRHVVITGAGSGLGLELARRFLSLGDLVVGLSRDEAKLRQLAVPTGPGRFVGHALDVRQPADVSRVFAAVGKDCGGRIDVLINNAAIFKMAPFGSFTLDEIAAIIDTNLKGAIYCTHQALPFLRSGSRIIHIGSVSGTHGIENQAAYSASKFGLDGFADALGQELSKQGIHTTTVCPGGIATPLWNETNPYPGDVGRLLQSKDVVDLVVHVAALPERVVMKKAILFPSNEWH